MDWTGPSSREKIQLIFLRAVGDKNLGIFFSRELKKEGFNHTLSLDNLSVCRLDFLLFSNKFSSRWKIFRL